MTLHVLDLTTFYPPHGGGVEAYAAALHEYLVDHGAHVTVLTSRRGGGAPLERTHGGRLVTHRYPAWEPVTSFAIPLVSLRRRARRIARERPVDVVIAHTRFYPASWRARRIARTLGARLVHIEHGGGMVQAGGPAVRLAARVVDRVLGAPTLRRADRVIGVSSSAAEFVHELSGRTAVVARRGIVPPTTAWTDPGGSPVEILFVGRLVDAKGVGDLIQAMAGLDARLMIVGDGPERPRLERLAEHHDVSVAFAGQQDPARVVHFMRSSHLLVNPSHTEGLPTVVLEAAALGMPIIATDVGGTREIVLPDVSGLLVPARDTAALNAAIMRLIHEDETRVRLGARARADTAQRFTWSGVGRHILDANA